MATPGPDSPRWPDEPQLPSGQRMRSVALDDLRRLVRSVVDRVPGLGARSDASRAQPLRSDNRAFMRWMAEDYGRPGKPGALAEIPWDYVREYEDRIPFLGLREYWYPAIPSTELRHNEAIPLTLLGDALVFFRDAEGRPRALEDRCSHRNALLSLGQVGTWKPGTLTCRYHGMTFDGEGQCTAVLTDGPDSPACHNPAYAIRSYPVEEIGGAVWIYMGDRTPQAVLDAVPHARTVFGERDAFVDRNEWPFSHLNTLDNDVDLAHPAALHHTCLPFSDQKLWGTIGFEHLDCGGLRAHYRDDEENPHAGDRIAGETDWHLPNLAYFAPGTLGGPGCGYFWAVPKDEGTCYRWFIFGGGPALPTSLTNVFMGLFFGRYFAYPGSPRSCSDGADAAMMASQGRIARWDMERLLRTDVAVRAARERVIAAHVAELQERAGR